MYQAQPQDPHTKKLYTASKFDKNEVLYGRFKIINELGRGISKVYKIQLLKDTFDGQKFAALKVVKFMQQEEINNNHKRLFFSNKSCKIIQYFCQEVKLLKKIQQYPNFQHIVKIYHSYYSDQRTTGYIVMEKLQYTLHLFIKNKKDQLDENQLIQLFYEVSLGVQELHSLHIMHRDIKPSNIVWDQNKNIWKIIDLGFSKLCGKNSFGDHSNLGSVQTKAPEFFRNDIPQDQFRQYDSKIDVWSLGVVYYFIVTGKYLFQFQNNIFMQEFRNKIHRQFETDKQSQIKKICKSEKIINFIKNVLIIQRQKRMDINQLFDHQIFENIQNIKNNVKLNQTNLSYATTKLSQEISKLQNIINYHSNDLQASIKLFTSEIDESEKINNQYGNQQMQ